MKQISFVATISYYWQQQWCRWITRLTPMLIGLALSILCFCGYRWYQLTGVREQVRQLEQGLAPFDRDVQRKQELAAEQVRLTAQLARLQRENHAAVSAQLVQHLTAIAQIIPLRLHLTALEITPGRQLILTGLSAKPALIVAFWQKLLSLPTVLDGKLINQTTTNQPKARAAQPAFQITLNLAPADADYLQDQTVISAGSA